MLPYRSPSSCDEGWLPPSRQMFPGLSAAVGGRCAPASFGLLVPLECRGCISSLHSQDQLPQHERIRGEQKCHNSDVSSSHVVVSEHCGSAAERVPRQRRPPRGGTRLGWRASTTNARRVGPRLSSRAVSARAIANMPSPNDEIDYPIYSRRKSRTLMTEHVPWVELATIPILTWLRDSSD